MNLIKKKIFDFLRFLLELNFSNKPITNLYNVALYDLGG